MTTDPTGDGTPTATPADEPLRALDACTHHAGVAAGALSGLDHDRLGPAARVQLYALVSIATGLSAVATVLAERDQRTALHPDLETNRRRIAAAVARRTRDRAFRAAASPVPRGGTYVPVAAGDCADWLLDQADETGEPVAVAAERDGRLTVYRLERIDVPDAPPPAPRPAGEQP